MILNRDDAVALGRAIIAAQDIAGRHGARLQSNVLVLAAELTSATGTTAPPEQLADEHIEYERIDVATTAELLDCTERNVRDLLARGRLPGQKIAGRWHLNREDVEVFRDWR
ncbi:hypothetical protein B842_09225 [Corynebacterium humireducens NBRC 106098 = DSM 45392]|uniref:Helix-turn-helix domain-containing protein n=1 Tax=Corynebacterium humireducens NBRC 106098 = DSM 45392 TaxID=1223515 RepID=A0A0B5DD45_9CORY|nr:hypothetical protein B842_09225 [Corynebacterium humireducens NBRC 106098 = DSM 45392]